MTHTGVTCYVWLLFWSQSCPLLWLARFIYRPSRAGLLLVNFGALVACRGLSGLSVMTTCQQKAAIQLVLACGKMATLVIDPCLARLVYLAAFSVTLFCRTMLGTSRLESVRRKLAFILDSFDLDLPSPAPNQPIFTAEETKRRDPSVTNFILWLSLGIQTPLHSGSLLILVGFFVT